MLLPATWKSGSRPVRPAGRHPLIAIGVFFLVTAAFALSAGSESLPREWAIGLPEPTGYVEPEDTGSAFCPLGICRPRSRDSLYASAAFGVAAVASAYMGRRSRRKPPSPEDEARP